MSDQSAPPSRGKAYVRLFAAFSAALLILMLAIAPDFGATWDEPQQHAKAHALVDYWAGRVPTLSVPIDGAHLYGAPLGVVAVLLEPLLPADPYVIRHLLIAVTGWLGLVLCGLLADRLFGPPHGVVALILLAACPRYMADAMNNPKDLPFATIATAFLLALTYVAERPPFIGWRLAVALGLILGAGLNVRAGALLFVGYLGVLLFYRLVQSRVTGRDYVVVGLRATVIVALALAAGWLTWPWAYRQPLLAPFRAMAELGHFAWGNDVLYAGRMSPSRALPAAYAFRWLWLTLPPVVLGGLALSWIPLLRERSKGAALAMWGALAFPVLYVVGTRATLYDGVRHLLFVLPPLAILAAAGWIGLLSVARGRTPRALVLAALALGLLEPLAFQVTNHPNQTAYFQPMTGGPRAAFARDDMDYWGNCVLESLHTIDVVAPDGPVSVSGWPLIVLQADIGRYPRLKLVEATEPGPDYFVQLARGTPQELRAFASRPDIVARITTSDGALLCAVEDRRGRR